MRVPSIVRVLYVCALIVVGVSAQDATTEPPTTTTPTITPTETTVVPTSTEPGTTAPSPSESSPAPEPISSSPAPTTEDPSEVLGEPFSFTPAPETPSPSSEMPEPTPETPAPTLETPAPTLETPAPTSETPAPIPETPAPTPETPAPTPETEAPTPETPAPTPETPTPTQETPAPTPETETPSPTEFDPGTVAPDTPAPSTDAPTTPAPTLATTESPAPETPAPTDFDPGMETPEPTPLAPETTDEPTTAPVETPAPTTAEPDTPDPTTSTPEPTTEVPPEERELTPEPTTPEPTPPQPTTPEPTTPEPTTPEPTTPEPTTPEPTTPEPTTPELTTPEPTTPEPTTPEPTTPEPTTPEPTTPEPTTAPVCGPRVRRSWTTLSTAEKDLYKDAINASMALGYHTLFTEVHSQLESGNEAHRSCGFIYWHRRFIYAYESMLRSLEPRFACITIPYWDYYADFARRLSRECTTFEGCSTFLGEMGGSSGIPSSVTINNIPMTGNCGTQPYMSNFCNTSSLPSTTCNRCIPRADWTTRVFPSGFGYASLARLLSGSYQYAVFSQNLQYQTHNSIHNAAMGAMGTMASSADPIYYNHHSTVDLVHQMFFECQVGREMATLEKQTSLYAFQQCTLSASDVCPTVMSNFTQDWVAPGSLKVRAEDHPMLAPFFAPLPSQYWQWVSGTDLGNLSYTYEKDALFAILENSGLSCPQNRIRRKLQEIAVAHNADERTRAVVKTFNLYKDLYNEALDVTRSRDAALEQTELIECLYYKEEFGFVDDFTDEFRRNMRLPSTVRTTCAKRVRELENGSKRIQVQKWKDTVQQHLG